MGWWFGRKQAAPDARPFVPSWLCSDTAEEGFARFLTFEIVGDSDSPPVAAVLADASDGLIAADADQALGGYAAYGQSISAAMQPLVDCYAVELFDDGLQLRAPSDPALQAITDDDLGNSPDSERHSRIQREQTPARSLPGALRLGYYDPGRDYQAGEARATASEQQFNEERRELPATATAAEAKSLAQQILARAWARRDKLTLRLPPAYLVLEPGERLQVPLSPRSWSVERCTVDGLAVIAELRPAWTVSPSLAADSGRIMANPDNEAAPLSLAVFDVPSTSAPASGEPTVILAASAPTSGWKRRSVELSFAGQIVVAQTARRKSLLGRALTALPPGEPYLIDAINTVDIELIDTDQWLTSCDDEALAAGANGAVIGNELIQFGAAVSLGPGRFRLSRLLRGRLGTEWAASSHAVNEVFCVLDRGTVQLLALPSSSMGASAAAASPGSLVASTTVSAQSLRPPSPVDLAAALQSSGELLVNWTRRSRNGWAWVDEVDAPLGERVEQYRVTISGSAGSVELSSAQQSLLTPVATVVSLGNGPVTIEVRQVGDFAASQPAQLTINLT